MAAAIDTSRIEAGISVVVRLALPFRQYWRFRLQVSGAP
jgi:hypothetical protein